MKNTKILVRIFSAITLILILMASLSSCVQLTDKQEKACSKADEIFEGTSEIIQANFSRKIKKIDGKTVYIAKLASNHATQQKAVDLKDIIYPAAKSTLEDVGIVLVIEYGDSKDNHYRMFDASKINENKLK